MQELTPAASMLREDYEAEAARSPTLVLSHDCLQTEWTSARTGKPLIQCCHSCRTPRRQTARRQPRPPLWRHRPGTRGRCRHHEEENP